MPESAVIEVVRRYVESVWNEGDPAALERMTAPGFEYRLGEQPARDVEETQAFIRATREAFPDWRVEIRETHEGTFHGIPPTGARVRVGGINLYHVSGGRVEAEWEQMDSLSLLQQLGAGGPPVRPGGVGPAGATAEGAHGEEDGNA